MNHQAHYNVMESLVLQEVQRQLSAYPITLRQYINQAEVATFALNRLPSLYASSKKGFHQQQQRGWQLKTQIQTAVRRGLAAVERDPLRQSISLKAPRQVANNRRRERRRHYEWSDARYCR